MKQLLYIIANHAIVIVVRELSKQ